MKNKSFKNKEKGFTLVETLVAISIFTMSILGLMSVLASGIANTTYTKNKMIAGYLAQEGIEYIRNMRDTYVLYDATSAANGWTNGFMSKLSSCTSAAASCGFDNAAPGPTTTISTCSGTVCALYLNQGVYSISHLSGSDSGFVRKIWRVPFAGNNEVKVFSEVDWKQNASSYSIILSEDLSNWVE